jgi:hypothetical protein
MLMESKVSVVIPTLGGNCLETTIKLLNSGTFIPHEILVCIPDENAYKVSTIIYDNVKIIKTSFRGQVAQRAFGFKIAKYDFVLQLDDDIHLENNCLEHLVNFIIEHPGSSVGPKLVDRLTGKYHSYLYMDKNDMSLLDKISFYILNGSNGCVPAGLSKAGIYMGLPEKPDNYLGAGWLSGGCILHKKENLVLDNYYPFSGKAYWEDVFHSDLLREKGVNLHRVGKAKCSIDFSENRNLGFLFFIKEFLLVLKIAKLYLQKNNKSNKRFIVFHLYNMIKLILKRLI